mgnify:CR=1 FL=1
MPLVDRRAEAVSDLQAFTQRQEMAVQKHAGNLGQQVCEGHQVEVFGRVAGET